MLPNKGVCRIILAVEHGVLGRNRLLGCNAVPQAIRLDGRSVNPAKVDIHPGDYKLFDPCKQKFKNNLYRVS